MVAGLGGGRPQGRCRFRRRPKCRDRNVGPRTAPDIWAARQFRANNAHAKLLAIVLTHRQPVDLLTGQRVDPGSALAWSNQREFHHFSSATTLRTVPSSVSASMPLATS